MIETKFKQTELGPIPEDWDVTPISKCLSFGNGRDYKHLDSGIYPVYGTGGLITHINDFLYEGESVCIGRKGSIDKPQFHSGRFWTVDTLYYTHSFNDVIPKYVYYCFLCINWRSLNEASGVPSLSQRIIGGQYIRVASSVYEQRKIAEALSDVDKLIRELDTLIEKKRSIMQGTMQALLTAHCRLPGFVHPWRNTLVEKCCKITTGKSNTQDQIESGIYPFYIRSATVMRSNSYIFDCEGVITIGDGQIGKVFHYVNGKFDLHQRCYLMYDFDDVDAKFFYFLFSFFFYNRVIALSAKATVDSVRRNMIAKMKINIPSTMQEQKAIANILSDMNDGIEAIEAKRDKYIAVRQGMLQQLLTGKIRLI